ncbi:MAG: nucleotide sugar dehydrogenase [Polyangiaceae bacterium]|jgi:UDPglucose 6-dehydrogenase
MGKRHYDCAVVGEWHLAFVTAGCLSSLGRETLLVNSNTAKSWSAFPELPLVEPELPEMMARSRAEGRLDYANGVSPDLSADYVWLAIDTPINDRDEADVTPLLAVAEQVSRYGCCKKGFVVTSQVPLGFGRFLEERFGLNVIYVPENLRLGKGVETFLRADRIVIGATRREDAEGVRALLDGIQTEFLLCDLPTSEMVKHATNAFLATSISFANELARIGDSMGVDNVVVGQALKMDKRIGKGAYVIPGLGFAGGTLPRDLRILQKLGHEKHIPTALVDAVLEVNEATGQALVSALTNFFGEGHERRRVLLLGYTYKPEADTLRRSPAIELAILLGQVGMDVYGHDPMMNQRDLSPLEGKIRHLARWEDLDFLPDAVVLMSPRQEFQAIDWAKLRQREPSRAAPLVLDTSSSLNAQTILGAGFAYKALWRPVRSNGAAARQS